ncbi:hypothetical protein HMI54_007080 [Coelomomyces lativittatus]|nr:hypothetical protein HMI56_003381 [Coelomomyces lativittatus]KAJ1517088.1 hypothetical protein HMI54_007080 [Coelomomyces lativittatus]
MKVSCITRTGTILEESIELEPGSTLADLKRIFHSKRSLYTPDRQKWTFAGKPLYDDVPLSSIGISNNSQLVFKDLGAQISWKTVFLIEYAGPLIIYPFFYYIFYNNVQYNSTQSWLYFCLMFHFIKRELETLFVHRFSHATMPLSNLFKNSFHYWIISGGLIAFTAFKQDGVHECSNLYLYFCLALFFFSQASNFLCHWKLRQLRPLGSKIRKIPYGYGFNWVSCPNYFFEALSWIAIFLLTWHWTSFLFIVFSVFQMYSWAVKKHKQYLKEFPNYPKHRKAMFPMIA